jgi:peptide/nickel transport system permease protein
MVFLIVRLVPGDIVEMILAEQPYAGEGAREQIEKDLGLHRPIPVQFVFYMGEVLRGDLGESYWTGLPVTEELRNRMPVTFELGVYAILLGLLIAIPTGVLSAVRQDTVADYVARSFAILALSVPTFFTATLLIVFPPQWGWAPPLTYTPWGDGVLDRLYYFFFPALLLGVSLTGGVLRMTRTMMLEVLRQDYIRTAWSKGLRERTIILRHAMKNALIPVITIIGLQAGLAVSGTIIIETIFNMPGTGRYLVGAIFERDYPAIQGVVLALAVTVVLVNIVVDVAYAYIDPRIRYN